MSQTRNVRDTMTNLIQTERESARERCNKALQMATEQREHELDLFKKHCEAMRVMKERNVHE